MELKRFREYVVVLTRVLLIVPYGIETSDMAICFVRLLYF